MDQIATLRPWAVTLLGIFLILDGLGRAYYWRSPNPSRVIWIDGFLTLIEIITGILFLLPG